MEALINRRVASGKIDGKTVRHQTCRGDVYLKVYTDRTFSLAFWQYDFRLEMFFRAEPNVHTEIALTKYLLEHFTQEDLEETGLMLPGEYEAAVRSLEPQPDITDLSNRRIPSSNNRGRALKEEICRNNEFLRVYLDGTFSLETWEYDPDTEERVMVEPKFSQVCDLVEYLLDHFTEVDLEETGLMSQHEYRAQEGLIKLKREAKEKEYRRRKFLVLKQEFEPDPQDETTGELARKETLPEAEADPILMKIAANFKKCQNPVIKTLVHDFLGTIYKILECNT
jgi:hypothetical protein